jgi:hypothetical protein
MNITRRNFLQGLGALSFNVAISIPSLSSNPLPAHTMYSVSMGRQSDEDHIKAAYLGIGPIGLEVGQGMSRFLEIELQRFPGADQGNLLVKLLGGPSIRDVESHLREKDIVAIVGSLDDRGLDYARDLALDKAQFIWTIVVCPPGPDDDVIGITPKPNEVVRVLRHSRYPLDHPEIFTRMIHDIWLFHNTQPQWDEMYGLFGDLGF